MGGGGNIVNNRLLKAPAIQTPPKQTQEGDLPEWGDFAPFITYVLEKVTPSFRIFSLLYKLLSWEGGKYNELYADCQRSLIVNNL